MSNLNLYCLFLSGLLLNCTSSPPKEKEEACAVLDSAILEVTALGKNYSPPENETAVYQSKFDQGGNTSVRNTNKENLEWKEGGYFQRNRDLGQVFTPERDFWLNAVVVRTGPTDKAVLSGTPGAKVFIQFYELEGVPSINVNNTPIGTEAKHGFTKNHRADDFIEGVYYRCIGIVRGGTFPAISPTYGTEAPSGQMEGSLHYLRWKLHDFPFKFQVGKSYAFVVGIENPTPEAGFTLANYNAAGRKDAPSIQDAYDAYHGGWGLRREGDGTVPPTMVPGRAVATDQEQLTRLYQESLFATGPGRYALQPTTDGYPDVDTYRDLEFALEVHWEKP